MTLAEATVVAAVFVLAGTVKGVIGLGLPTVALGLLAASVGLERAMALMLVPSFVTNVWQALAGRHTRAALHRTWPFLLAATVAVWPGALLAAGWTADALTALLGLLLVAYGVLGLTRFALAMPRRHEVWAGPLLGGMNGVLTGLTGSFAVPGVLYLGALALPRDALVQAMGLLFTASTVALGVVLAGLGRLPAETGLASALAVLPALAGMVLGQRIRGRLSDTAFRRAFQFGLIALGTYILAR